MKFKITKKILINAAKITLIVAGSLVVGVLVNPAAGVAVAKFGSGIAYNSFKEIVKEIKMQNSGYEELINEVDDVPLLDDNNAEDINGDDYCLDDGDSQYAQTDNDYLGDSAQGNTQVQETTIVGDTEFVLVTLVIKLIILSKHKGDRNISLVYFYFYFI